MDDLMKIVLAGLFALIGSHLLLWAWLKRKIADVKSQVEAEQAAEKAGDLPAGDASGRVD